MNRHVAKSIRRAARRKPSRRTIKTINIPSNYEEKQAHKTLQTQALPSRAEHVQGKTRKFQRPELHDFSILIISAFSITDGGRNSAVGMHKQADIVEL